MELDREELKTLMENIDSIADSLHSIHLELQRLNKQ